MTVVVVGLRVLFPRATAHLHIAVRNRTELRRVIVETIASCVFFFERAYDGRALVSLKTVHRSLLLILSFSTSLRWFIDL